MIKILKTIIDWAIPCLFVFSIVAFVIFAMIKCQDDRDNQQEYNIRYGIEHPKYYEITFVDGYKDTISVWTSPSYGDYIEMYRDGGTFTNGSVALSYTPYRKYTRTDCISCNGVTLYNVLRYRKLRDKFSRKE